MSLTAKELAQVVEEIAPILQGGWIQKIHQPKWHTLVFEVRLPGRTYRALMSCDPNHARLHLLSAPLPNPPIPRAFCQFLRAHLQGARIDGLQQVPQDRIARWQLTAKEGPRTLICQLTGKTGNLLVTDDQGVILRSLLKDRHEPGKAYRLPVKPEASAEEFQTSRFSTGTTSSNFPVSTAIEAHYREQERVSAVDAAGHARVRSLKQTLKKAQRRISGWKADLAKADRYRDYARYGELLKANLGSIRKGMDHVRLVDYFDATLPEITIPLDDAKSPQGNMDDYFKKHRKYLAAERELKPRIAQAERDIDRLRRELAAAEQGTSLSPGPAPTVVQTAIEPLSRRRKASPPPRHRPFRRFTSADGLPIFVGRHARENEELTFRLAKSDDVWLHARGTPGSHVVVRLEKGQDPPPETLRDAATLALLYSDQKKSGKGEVIYTRRKWVRKAKGQAPGAVIVTQEKSLHITLDTQRLAELRSRDKNEA